MKILCVGDNVIDYYENLGEMYPGGNAVNVAVHSSILGAKAAYMGNLGTDPMSDVIRRALSKFNVDMSGCVTITDGTTKYCNYEVHDGERKFCSVNLGSNWSGPMDIGEAELTFSRQFDVIHSSSNAKMENEVHKFTQLPPIYVYDFGEKEKYRAEEYLNKVCLCLDLALFSLPYMSETDALDFCKRIYKKNVKHVLITMGKDGQYVYNGTELLHGKAKMIDPLDTMGAGDSYIAAFVNSLYNDGWQKGMTMPAKALKKALLAGCEYSTENCKVKGAFGYSELL